MTNLQVLARLAAVALALAVGGTTQGISGGLEISQAWTPAPPKGASVAAGYVTIKNTGSQAEMLVGGTADIAKRVQIHEMRMTNGIMRMRQIKPGLVIKPGETARLQPGGNHIMFLDVERHPAAGDTFTGTLQFEKSGPITTTFQVMPLGTRVGPNSRPNAVTN